MILLRWIGRVLRVLCFGLGVVVLALVATAAVIGWYFKPGSTDVAAGSMLHLNFDQAVTEVPGSGPPSFFCQTTERRRKRKCESLPSPFRCPHSIISAVRTTKHPEKPSFSEIRPNVTIVAILRVLTIRCWKEHRELRFPLGYRPFSCLSATLSWWPVARRSREQRPTGTLRA